MTKVLQALAIAIAILLFGPIVIYQTLVVLSAYGLLLLVKSIIRKIL